MLLALLVGVAMPAHAAEAPQLIKANLKGGYFEIDARYEEKEKSDSQLGSQSYDNERLDVRPKVHLDFDGSIYHPNLIDYDLSVELGASYEREKLKQPGAADPKRSRSDTNPLQFYNAHALILREKKISGALFGNRKLIRLDNGFFSRRLVDHKGYGGKLNYSGDVLPWSLTATHSEEEETDTRTPRDSEQDELNFHASNVRVGQGRTTFHYLYQDFERQDFNVAAYNGSRNTARLNDSSYFMGDRLHLGSHLNYNDVNSTTIPSTTLTLKERLNVRHTDNLESRYVYSYNDRDSGSTESTSHEGSALLRHELYDSLVSTVSGDYRDVSFTSLDATRYGFTLDEAYTKRVGSSSRLDLGGQFRISREDRQTSSSATIQISDEPQTLTTGTLTTLNQPNVIRSTIVVTDSTGTILYREFFDYNVIPRGDLTEIERVVGGSIPNGSLVLIDYAIENPGDGAFTTYQRYYRFRYSLIDQLISIYGHHRSVDNDGGDQFTLEDLDETVIGLDSSWRGLTAGIEYEYYDSSLLPTESFRSYQSVTFSPGWRSSLRIAFDQSWISYLDSDEEIWRFFYNINYGRQFTQRLAVKADLAYYMERGKDDETLDRDSLAAGAEMNYRVGKTSFAANYEYREDDYLNEDRKRQTVYLNVRRRF
jgi:hypothetical protein